MIVHIKYNNTIFIILDYTFGFMLLKKDNKNITISKNNRIFKETQIIINCSLT